jgi:peroxiredoxin
MPHRRRRFVVLLKSGLNILEVGLAKPSAAPGGVALDPESRPASLFSSDKTRRNGPHHTLIITMKRISFLTLLSIAVSSAFLVAEEKPPTHLKTGDSIPDVVLRDADGGEFKLREHIAKQPAVLIFYRGGWCPYCTKHLMALIDIKDKLVANGYQLLAISPDQPAKLKETPNREKLGYTLLSDSEMAAAKAFKISFQVPDELVSKYKDKHQIDLEAASGKTHHMLPHPAVFVVGKDGVIRFAHVNPDYKTRLDPEAILKAADQHP